MKRLRPFVALLLATILAIGSGAMAVARGQATAAGEMVLCTGDGMVTVAVDMSGTPVGLTHICPDCALHFLALEAVPPAGVVRPAETVREVIAPTQTPRPRGRTPAAYQARGPPIPS